MPSQRRGQSCVLAIALLVLAAPVSAHHGIGRFDPTREINVEGTLTSLDFVNPHSYVHFNTVDANGAPCSTESRQRSARLVSSRGSSSLDGNEGRSRDAKLAYARLPCRRRGAPPFSCQLTALFPAVIAGRGAGR